MSQEIIREPGESSQSQQRRRLHSIIRAPAHIRDGRESDFEPKLVSIGPYFYGRENLKRMEKVKLRCALDLIKKVRGDENTLRSFLVGELGNQENQVRECYEETNDLPHDDFIWMLGIDSCFIIRIALSFSQAVQESMDLLDDVNIKHVRSDMLLLENQIPLFFITKVYQKLCNTAARGYPPFRVVFAQFLSSDMPWGFNIPNAVAEAHLLDLYWHYSLPKATLLDHYFGRSLETVELPSPETVELPSPEALLETVELPSLETVELPSLEIVEPATDYSSRDQTIQESPTRKPEQEQVYKKEQPCWAEVDHSIYATKIIPNATVLHQMAGITFEELNNAFTKCLVVTFSKKKGILRMPCLKMHTCQSRLLLNLITLEYSKPLELRFYSNYMKLMDALIDTKKDVELLQQCGVLRNTLSSHLTAATFFNDIGDLCVIDNRNHIFSSLYEDVLEYYNSKWNRRWASLRNNYFSSPWAGVSVVAGGTLLILTVVQTFYTVSAYYSPDQQV